MHREMVSLCLSSIAAGRKDCRGLYVAKVEKPGMILQLGWINEVKVTNLLKANAFMFGATPKLN